MQKLYVKIKREISRKFFIVVGLASTYLLLTFVSLPFTQLYFANTFSQQILMFSGFLNNGSIMSVGISPWITASLVIYFLQMFNNTILVLKESKDKIILLIGFIVAILQSAFIVLAANYELAYKVTNFFILLSFSFFAFCLSKINEKYGFGSLTIFIIVNITLGFYNQFKTSLLTDGFSMQDILFIIILSVIFIVLYSFMELSEYRIPVTKIMIKSEFENESYIPFKINIIGVMPIMLSGAGIMLIRAILLFISSLIKDGPIKNFLLDFSSQNNINGIIFFGLFVVVLTIFMSFAVINPSKLSEDYQKQNDIVNYLKPGYQTKKYLQKCVAVISSISGLINSFCICLPAIICLLSNLAVSNYLSFSSLFFYIGLWFGFADSAKHEYSKLKYFKKSNRIL